jgi:hypothetical protein
MSASQQIASVDFAGLGHNSGTAAIAGAIKAATDLGAFLGEHSAITAEPVAQTGAKLVKAAKAAVKGIDTERKSRLAPLNEQVASVRDEYRAPETTLGKLVDRLSALLTTFSRAEEAKRAAEAAERRRFADEAEKAAREAEAREREATENASLGEIGVDVGAATAAADQAFAERQQRERAALRAEKAVPVRLASDETRALSLRSFEILTVTDAAAALHAIGMTPKLEDALFSAAREHRKTWGELPPGITSRIERRI